jgi:hypothetical protein
MQDRGDALAETVVQIASEAPTLVFLNPPDRTRQIAEARLPLGEVGDNWVCCVFNAVI